MSNAEQLIENIIIAMSHGIDIDEFLDREETKELLKLTGIMPGDLYSMAHHIVYGLYNGKFPDLKE